VTHGRLSTPSLAITCVTAMLSQQVVSIFKMRGIASIGKWKFGKVASGE
jgi:hypothetical protein